MCVNYYIITPAVKSVILISRSESDLARGNLIIYFWFFHLKLYFRAEIKNSVNSTKNVHFIRTKIWKISNCFCKIFAENCAFQRKFDQFAEILKNFVEIEFFCIIYINQGFKFWYELIFEQKWHFRNIFNVVTPRLLMRWHPSKLFSVSSSLIGIIFRYFQPFNNFILCKRVEK